MIAQWAAFVVGLAIIMRGEIPRITSAIDNDNLVSLLFDMNVETTPFLILFLLLPLCWLVRRPLLSVNLRSWRQVLTGSGDGENELPTAGVREWFLAIFVGGTAIAASCFVARQTVRPRDPIAFGTLPPAYHDEFSYLFQAKSLLAGSMAFPSHPEAPELFDQVHVLNDEGRFASRFFPGTGIWMSPFLAIGNPYWGHWLAGGLTAFFMFWAGRELGGNRVGLLAGLLTALSPGMALFSNLLLAHHPGLAGLSLFLFTFLRMMRTPRWTWAILAGCGLSFAMLCRPMTAAGFGLPFGIWFAWWLIRGGQHEEKSSNSVRSPTAVRWRLALALSLPIVAGFSCQIYYNQATTGSLFTTPYQRYTDIYTPRHVYGFNNVLRGERKLGPKVLENYDRWTENLAPRLWERGDSGQLVPSLAVRNVKNRLWASLSWSLALVPLAMASVVFLVGGTPTSDRRWWLIAVAILSLHAAHVPYWYDGIMHWHYVFETGPLWLLVFAGTTVGLFKQWRTSERHLMPLWWGSLVIAALLTTYTSFQPLTSISRLDAAVNEIAFSRLKYEAFQRRIVGKVNRPALILIEHDPADRHIDYVTNSPDLADDVLLGRFHPGKTDWKAASRHFPNRTLYLFRAKTGQLTQLDASN